MSEDSVIKVDSDTPIETETEPEEITSEQLKLLERERKITITFNRIFGIALLVLSSIIIVLVIITYFYHPSQNDATALLLEQIMGYVLASLGSITGIALLVYAKRKKAEPLVVVEEIGDIDTNEEPESQEVKQEAM